MIVKPHGLRGEVILALSTNRTERADAGAVLSTAEGTEFRVVRSSPHRGRFIVALDGVHGIDDAAGNVLGAVEGVQANPASDLLVLADGALVPLRFVVDHEPGVRVTVDVPDGLFDLA